MLVGLNFIKTLVNGLKKRIENIPQTDWNQNNEAAQSFLKNRPFWYYVTDSHAVNKGPITSDTGPCVSDLSLEAGKTYHVTFNGVEYSCVARSFYFNQANSNVISLGMAIFPDEIGDEVPFNINRVVNYTETFGYSITTIPAEDPNIYVAEYNGKLEHVKQMPAACVPYVQADFTEQDNTLPSFVKNRPAYSGMVHTVARNVHFNNHIAELDADGIVRGHIYASGTLSSKASVNLKIGTVSLPPTGSLPVSYDIYKRTDGGWAVMLPSGELRAVGNAGDSVRVNVNDGSVTGGDVRLAMW